jgi:hypothetical protein
MKEGRKKSDEKLEKWKKQMKFGEFVKNAGVRVSTMVALAEKLIANDESF